jgi:hypothetical protein
MPNGSASDPFTDLKTALQNPLLQAGDTIYLRQGTHRLTEDVTISASGVTIKPYPGEQADICFYSRDGWKRLFITGNNVRFRHLRIWSDPPHRLIQGTQDRANNHMGVIEVQGDAPADGLFADCTLHDLYGVWWFAASKGGMLYRDCTVYNFGLTDINGRPDGEMMYTQNWHDAPVKQVANTIFGMTYSLSFQLYTGNGYVRHYRFDDLIFCRSDRIYHHSSTNAIEDVAYTRLMRLDTPFVEYAGVTRDEIALPADTPAVSVCACTTDGAARIAHIGVWNPSALAAVDCNVSALNLADGAYRLRNALNPLAEWATVQCAGGVVSVPMDVWTIAAPIGEAAALRMWDARYGAFLLEHTS